MKSLLRPRALSKRTGTAAEAAGGHLEIARALLMATAICIVVSATAALVALPARAAAVIEYFNAVPNSSAVLLEWATASEYNVAGFDVLSKKVDEPRGAYRRLAFQNAKGTAEQGAQYDLLVTDLAPGQPYCFRLEEKTTDETPGEVRERCGYGLGIGPTAVPSPTATLTQTLGLTPTVVLFPTAVAGPDGLVPTATIPGMFPPDTPDPNQYQEPFETLTPTWTPDPLLPTPFPAEQPTLDPLIYGTPTLDPLIYGTPTLDPLIYGTPTLDPLIYGTPTVDPFAVPPQQFDSPLPLPTPMPLPTVPLTQTLPADPGMPGGGAAGIIAGDGSIAGDNGSSPADAPTIDAAPATPTSLYVIVTAVPTTQGQGIVPALTPWPTATPPTPFQLTGLLAPTAQNLTVMLLCFIFLSATGLGMLGLLTGLVYMRSRSQREAEDLRLRTRRRLL